jgi:hypothetical protein
METPTVHGMFGFHPYFDIRHNKHGRVVSCKRRQQFTPKEIPSWTLLLLAEWTPGLPKANFKISKDTTGNIFCSCFLFLLSFCLFIHCVRLYPLSSCHLFLYNTQHKPHVPAELEPAIPACEWPLTARQPESAEIEPGTFRLVALCLYQLRHRSPLLLTLPFPIHCPPSHHTIRRCNPSYWFV